MTWLITGASGLLGSQICHHLDQIKVPAIGVINQHDVKFSATSTVHCDITKLSNLKQLLEDTKPRKIIHCAALTNVDSCETHTDLAEKLHINVPEFLAQWSQKYCCKMVYISTDHLWDGTKHFVEENEPTTPLNIYASTKRTGELAVLKNNPNALIARTNFYGKGLSWRASFSDWVINTLNKGEKISGYTDVFFSPLHREQLIHILFELLQLDASGIYHVVSSERISKYEFIKKVAIKFGLPHEKLMGITSDSTDIRTLRPKDMSLSSKKISDLLGRNMPSIDEGIDSLYVEMNG